MLKLSEYNKIIIEEIREEDRKKVFTGVACDDCGTELKYVDYYSTLLSYPAQKNVICPNCGKKDYIVVK